MSKKEIEQLSVESHIKNLQDEINDLTYLKNIINNFNNTNDNYLDFFMRDNNQSVSIFIKDNRVDTEFFYNLNKFMKEYSKHNYYFVNYEDFVKLIYFNEFYNDITKKHYKNVAESIEAFLDKECEIYGY